MTNYFYLHKKNIKFFIFCFFFDCIHRKMQPDLCRQHRYSQSLSVKSTPCKLLVQMGKNVSEYSPVLLLFAQFISKKHAL